MKNGWAMPARTGRRLPGECARCSRLGGLSADEGRKIVWTLEKYGLSTQPPIPAKEAAQEAVYDKKMEFGLINLVLLESIGKGRIVKMTVPELIESLD